MSDRDDFLIRALGWHATVLHGDPCVWDRWRWLRTRLQGGNVRTLEAGSGSGAFTLYAARVGNRATGISFSGRNNDAARRRAGLLELSNASFVDGDLRELSDALDPAERFDQILCLEVIEHLQDDALALRELAAHLNPGGRLFITTPAADYRGLLGDRVSETEDGGHVRWGYTTERLSELLGEAGLDVVEFSRLSGVVSQQLTNLMRLVGKLSPLLGWAVTLPLRPLQLLDRPLTNLVGYPYLGVGVVARRTQEGPS
jgi:SAM-dependent methyltransferase